MIYARIVERQALCALHGPRADCPNRGRDVPVWATCRVGFRADLWRDDGTRCAVCEQSKETDTLAQARAVVKRWGCVVKTGGAAA